MDICSIQAGAVMAAIEESGLSLSDVAIKGLIVPSPGFPHVYSLSFNKIKKTITISTAACSSDSCIGYRIGGCSEARSLLIELLFIQAATD